MIINVMFCLLGFLLFHAYKVKALGKKDTTGTQTAVKKRQQARNPLPPSTGNEKHSVSFTIDVFKSNKLR